MEYLQGARKGLIQILKNKGITDQNVLKAFDQVERHLFVESFLWPRAYEDMALIIHEAYSQPYRELHYFAMTLLETHKKNLQEQDIHLVEWMVTTNSWWDTVDYIATRGAGELVKKYPKLIKTMDKWSTHENMWLRRIAILHQMKFKQKTDVNRLFDYCKKNATDQEFFIQKAMGWAFTPIL